MTHGSMLRLAGILTLALAGVAGLLGGLDGTAAAMAADGIGGPS